MKIIQWFHRGLSAASLGAATGTALAGQFPRNLIASTMSPKSILRIIGAAVLLAVQPMEAGQYAQDFDLFALGATNFGDGSQLSSSEPGFAKVEDPSLKELQLSQWDASDNTRAAFLLPDLDPGAVVGGFSASWVSPMYGNFPAASIGFSFSFGPLRSVDLVSEAYAQERGFGTGLTFCVPTFQTVTTPGWYVRHNGAILATVTNDPLVTWGNFSAARHTFQVSWNMIDGLSASQDGVVIFTNVPTPGFLPQPGDSFAWATRSFVGFGETFRIDNISVTTVTSGPPIIVTATAANGLLPIATLASGVNGRGLATTVICEFGTDTSYGISATNFIAGTNWQNATNGLVTSFANSFPFDTDRSIPLYARVTASNALGTTISNLTFASSSFERRLGNGAVSPLTAAQMACSAGVWLDVNDDGLLDLAVSGKAGMVSAVNPPNGIVYLNPGAVTSWPMNATVPHGKRTSIIVGDFDNDNRPDSLWLSGYGDIFPSVSGAEASLLYGVPANQTAQFGKIGVLGGFFLDSSLGVARDFDHDGRQDILILGGMEPAGSTDPLVVNGVVSRLMRNEFSGDRGLGVRGLSNFRMMTCGLPIRAVGGIVELENGASLADGDLDGDGFPDLYFYGYPAPVFNTDLGWGIYRSDGEMGLLTVETGNRHVGDTFASGASSIWADFNGDGWDDLLVSEGTFVPSAGGPPFRGIFLNDGQGHLTNSGWSLPAPPLGFVAVTAGDIFNHGRNDIVIMGQVYGTHDTANGSAMLVLRNEGGGVFTPFDFGFPQGMISPEGKGCQLADYDKDGRLDLSVVAGFAGTHADSVAVYRNELNISSNAPPQAPVNLSTVVGPGTVTFHWGSATDDITPTNLLTYDLRVGTNALGTSVVSPLANVTNGWRKVSGPGSCRHIFSTVYRFPPGTYFWSVQAVDGGFKGGAWAPEGTFTVPAVPEAMVDTVFRSPGRGLKIPVATLLANDPAPAGSVLTVTGVDATSAGGVPVQLTGGTVIYAPAAGFNASDSFSYTFSDGTHTATGTVHVFVGDAPDAPTQNLLGAVLGGGGEMSVTAAGIPGRSYRLQTTGSLAPPITWTHSGPPAVAPANGRLVFTDPSPTSPGFYRVVQALP